MTSPGWRNRQEPFAGRDRRWGYQSDEPELRDTSQFDYDWRRLAALSSRAGLAFSLAYIKVDDALRGGQALGVGARHSLARLLLSETRVEDSVCRLSGSTFAVLLAGDTVEGARAFVERVRSRLAGQPVSEGGRPVFLDASGGGAEWSGEMSSLTELVESAAADLDTRRDAWVQGDFTDWNRSD